MLYQLVTQESKNNQLDLGLGFKGEDGDNSQNVDEQLRTSSGGKSTSWISESVGPKHVMSGSLEDSNWTSFRRK